jgi:hypothetical protein
LTGPIEETEFTKERKMAAADTGAGGAPGKVTFILPRAFFTL